MDLQDQGRAELERKGYFDHATTERSSNDAEDNIAR